MPITKNIVAEATKRLKKNRASRIKVTCEDLLKLAGGEAPAAAPVAAPDHESLRELDLLREVVGAAEEKGRKRLGKALDAYRDEFANPDADDTDSDDDDDNNDDE